MEGEKIQRQQVILQRLLIHIRGAAAHSRATVAHNTACTTLCAHSANACDFLREWMLVCATHACHILTSGRFFFSPTLDHNPV